MRAKQGKKDSKEGEARSSNKMADISHVRVEQLSTSQYVQPLRLLYKEDGVEKYWDLLRVHRSVAIIIFNKTRNVLVMVKQFRPAVYLASIPEAVGVGEEIDTTVYPGFSGLTYELCAGLIDKNKPIVEIAKDEVLEECGYDVPVSRFEEVISFCCGVGVMGDRQTLYYVEVEDSMKVSEGGGVTEEGETLEVVEFTLKEAKDYITGKEVISPPGLLFGLTWFFQNRAPPIMS